MANYFSTLYNAIMGRIHSGDMQKGIDTLKKGVEDAKVIMDEVKPYIDKVKTSPQVAGMEQKAEVVIDEVGKILANPAVTTAISTISASGIPLNLIPVAFKVINIVKGMKQSAEEKPEEVKADDNTQV